MNELIEWAEKTRKEMSDAFIARGVYPGMKKYESVKPRGIFKLSPKAWRTAKSLENARDYSYELLMNDVNRAVSMELARAVRAQCLAHSSSQSQNHTLKETL